MLTQDEELWAKELPPAVEELLAEGKDPLADRSDRSRPGAGLKRDKTRVINYRVPHNAAVQIYDYRDKKARYIAGVGGAVSGVGGAGQCEWCREGCMVSQWGPFLLSISVSSNT